MLMNKPGVNVNQRTVSVFQIFCLMSEIARLWSAYHTCHSGSSV